MSSIGLIVIVALMPVVGFVMTLNHAKKGDTRGEQRWRKRHGILFWSFLPGIAGILTALGFLDVLPSLFTLLGVIILSLSTVLSWSLQKKHDDDIEE